MSKIHKAFIIQFIIPSISQQVPALDVPVILPFRPCNNLHLLRVRNARVLSKRRRPNATVQLLLRLEVVQHLLIVDGAGADHPDVRLGL